MKKLAYLASIALLATFLPIHAFAQNLGGFGIAISSAPGASATTFNVVTFGAKCDGSTDDTSAIQAAINAAFSSGGGTVIFSAPKLCLVTSQLTLKSGVNLSGAGKYISGITMPQSNQSSLWNMLGASASLSNVAISDLTVRGSRLFQTTPGASGQVGWGAYLTGSVSNITFQNVNFTELGDQSNVGGGGIGITVNCGSCSIANVTIDSSDFYDIANVPGVYFFNGSSNATVAKTIRITRDLFTIVNGASQNTIYLAGADSSDYFDDVQTNNNTIIAAATFDSGVEYDWVENSTITGNTFLATGSAAFEPILLRDGDRSIAVTDNVARGNGTGTGSSSFASVLNGAAGIAAGTQRNISFTGNNSYGFGQFGISIGAGTSNFDASNNILAAGSSVVGEALRCAGTGVANGSFNGNTVIGWAYAVGLSTCAGLTVAENTLIGNGDAASGLIATENVNQGVTGLVVRNNHVLSFVASTPYFASVSTLATTGNIITDNDIDGLTLNNPSYSPWATSSVLLVGGTSGHTVPFLDGANTWSATQSFATITSAQETATTETNQGNQVVAASGSTNTAGFRAQNTSQAWQMAVESFNSNGWGLRDATAGTDALQCAITTVLCTFGAKLTVPNLLDTGLSASAGVFTDSSKNLTSTAPATVTLVAVSATGANTVTTETNQGNQFVAASGSTNTAGMRMQNTSETWQVALESFNSNGWGVRDATNGVEAIQCTVSTVFCTFGGRVTVPSFVDSGTVTFSGLGTSTAALDYLCWNASGGAVTADGSGTCLASLEEMKDIVAYMAPEGALAEVMKLKPFWGKYKNSVTSTSDHRIHAMFGAHQVESVDPRLSAYDGNGELHGVRYTEMSALNTAAIKALNSQIRRLTKRLAAVEAELRAKSH